MTLFSRLKNLSEQLFTKHLFLTNTTLGVFFFGVADVVQQNIEKRLYEGKTYESKRTRNMVVAGTAIGIGGHYWYTFLDRRFPGATRKAVIKKLLCEMALGPPLFLAFFVIMGYLNKKPVKKSTDEFMKNLPLVLVADWAVYAPLQAVNFFYVHPKYRFLYVCALCFVYDIFMSYITHKEDNEKFAKKSET